MKILQNIVSNPSRGIMLILTFLLGFSISNIAFADCDHVGAYIVNLSQDDIDIRDGLACTSEDTDSEIQTCIADEIRDNLPDECETHFDIFVPGTNAEHGAWKQFNRMFKTDTNRAHLVLGYDDTRDVEGVNYDPAFYDRGVLDSRRSLIHLLDALDDNFNVEQIRVFGHSKGSHTVALVSEISAYNEVEFYAFAQPGRTAVDIVPLIPFPEVDEGKLGRPGYIEKLSDNLVGITWKNDEVQYFTGGALGISLPEIWQFPGYIWQENNGGGASTGGYLHIDHHNNYGGFYTDGIGGNQWRDGEGTVQNAYAYCTTGDKSEAKSSDECGEQNITKSPYFWGTPECVAEAYRMMKKGETGDRYNIGYSGPRQRDSCKQSEHLMEVRWNMDYSFNLPDRNCVYTLRFGFEDITSGKERGSFEVVGTTDNDQEDLSANGNVFVPIHMQLKIKAKLTERSVGSTNNCSSLAQSEAWIESLRLTFDHPGTSESNKEVTIIGNDEGRGAINNLHMFDNVAWEHPSLDNDEMRIYYEPLKNSIKIQNKFGDGSSNGDEGNFRKRVHLLD